jgi:hypothetical protein
MTSFLLVGRQTAEELDGSIARGGKAGSGFLGMAERTPSASLVTRRRPR